MSNAIEKTAGDHVSPFEQIKRTNEANNEYWESRDLAEVLEYTQYRNFEAVIEKAKLACFNSGHRIEDHFADVSKMIEIGKGGRREIDVTLLSRYACYLAIQNADPKKEIVAHGQTYFAIQTRRQELEDGRIEDERRVLLREEMRQHNVQLAGAAKDAGVVEPIDYAIFQNHGYMGLYGGLKQEDIHRRKGLKKSQKILDHMGSTELAANLFRATQAEEKLRRDKVKGKDAANRTHRQVGAKVRQTIQELGGTMPEELPVVESIKKIDTVASSLQLMGVVVQESPVCRGTAQENSTAHARSRKPTGERQLGPSKPRSSGGSPAGADLSNAIMTLQCQKIVTKQRKQLGKAEAPTKKTNE